MLLSEYVKIKWNSKNKKHYIDLGYKFTKMNDEFIVNVKDLTIGCNVKVDVQCDYCNNKYSVPWYNYYKVHNSDIINKDCCKSPECTGKKAQEALRKKYGVNTIWEVDSIREKREKTNIERYGCKNPFGNDEIKNKIKQYNIKNYNVEYSMQRPDVVEKSKVTCMEKYGVTNYGKIYSETHCGELSPSWKGGVKRHRVERSQKEYREWRKSVFERDFYTCQCCGNRNGNGRYIRLEAHHIKDWKNNVNERFDIENGITLCSECHTLFHSEYGKHGNNNYQLLDFLHNHKILDEKIC